MSAVPREFSMRAVPEELRRRYLREGLWTDETLGGLVDACLCARPALPFRIWSERRPFASRVGDLHAQARRLATGLQSLGLGPGDVVAFQLPNWAEAAATFFGLSMLGAVLVPVVHSYGAKELGFILRQSGARALIVADRFGRLDYAATVATLRPSLPDLELVVMVATGDGAVPAGTVSFEEVASSGPLRRPFAVSPDSPAVIAYTSGTTAEPKGVIHTHRSLLAEIRQLAGILPEGDRPGLIGAPVAHAIGMLGGLLLPLHRGRAIHLTDVWRPAAVLEAMRAANLTAGSGATVFLTSLLDAPEFTPADAARIDRVGLGSAPVPIAVAERAEALGIGVARAYGSTEHPSITGSLPDAPREKRNRTDGRALAGVEIRLVDDAGREVDPGKARSGAGAPICARATRIRHSTGTRSMPMAGMRAATSASSMPTDISRSPIARRTSSSAAEPTSALPRSRSSSRRCRGSPRWRWWRRPTRGSGSTPAHSSDGGPAPRRPTSRPSAVTSTRQGSHGRSGRRSCTSSRTSRARPRARSGSSCCGTTSGRSARRGGTDERATHR
jgi:non-ribosomal peptide synthetase component E (peptide arylation enzyme)